MNKSNINSTKAFLTIIIFSLLALYSCKKDEDADTPFNPIAGVWQSTNSSDVKFYDVVTGAEKFNPGIDVSASGSITFEADGRYLPVPRKVLINIMQQRASSRCYRLQENHMI